MLEENENHAHQSQTFITTTVRNNYNGIGISSEINSCYRKVTIFYLNSTATRITWQQHTSVETVLVFDEENTLAPEVMDGHLNSILKGTEMYLNLFPSLWLQKGVTTALPKWREREKINSSSSAARVGLQSQSKYRSRSQGRVGFLCEEGSKNEEIPSSSLEVAEIRTVLDLLSLARGDQADAPTATDFY